MLLQRQIDDSTTALAGLSWDVGSDKGMGRAEARARAKGANAHAFMLRAQDRNLATCQLTGKLSAWRDVRIIPLGAALAETVDALDWCGVFEFEGRYVFFAAHNGCIQPDADTVYSAAAEARTRLDEETQFSLTGTIFAPDSWEYPSSLSSSELIAKIDWAAAGEMTQLNDNAPSRAKSIMLGSLAVLALGGLGFHYWRAAELEKETLARQQAAQAAPVPVDPWLTKPKPIAAYQACQSIRGLMAEMSHYGWLLDKLECDIEGSKFNAELSAYTAAPALPPRHPSTNLAFKADGSGLVITGPLKFPASPTRQGEKGTMETTLAARNMVVSYSTTASWQTTGNQHKITFDVPANLQEIAGRLTAIPTFSITRLEFSGDNWRVQSEAFN